MKLLLNVPELKTHMTLQNVMKIYPIFTKIYVFHEPITIKKQGYELQNKKQKSNNNTFEYIDDSIRRTKTTISDLILCNNFDYFVTFTFAKDRYNIEKCKKRMTKWLYKQQQRYGEFQYLIVPEHHKDGALHFHALLRNYKGQIKPAFENNKKIYNIKSYKHGYSTLIKINKTNKDTIKLSNYLKKYITKDMPTDKNKKRYWVSRNLTRPVKIHNVPINNIELSYPQQFKTDSCIIYQSEVLS
jgi:hypothetical protein